MATKTHTDNVEWHSGKNAYHNDCSFFDNPYRLDCSPDSRYSRWALGYRTARNAAEDGAVEDNEA